MNRKARRAARRSGAKPGAQRRLPTVDDRQAFAVHAFHVSRVAAATAMQEPGGAEGLLAAAQQCLPFGQAGIEQVSGAQRPACEAGCSYCCHISVAASFSEAYLVAQLLRESLAVGELLGFCMRLAEEEALSSSERLKSNTPCAFLGDQRLCSIYDVRPMACRGWHSLDVAACERGFASGDPGAEVPTIEGRMSTASAVSFALCTAAMDAGLDGRPVRLVAAVRAMLEEPDRIHRWLQGEPNPDRMVDQAAAREWSENDYGTLADSAQVVERLRQSR